MGLICWLPLMGTLENKGVSNVTITGTNITSNTSGKIGSCYSFNGSSSYIKLDQSFVTNSTTEFSYACWVKFNSTASACLFSARTATNSNGISLFVNNSGNILYDIGNERRSKAYSFSTGIWYHITFTYKKGSYKKIYVNGTEIDSIASTGTMTSVGSIAFIGASQNANTTVNANYLNGYLNDVRIWNNHCLSTAEVREISQGLVLHYKLDSIDIKTGTNLVTSITTGGQTSLLTDGRLGVKTSGTNADTWFTINLSETITAGTSYFLSCDASGISAGQYWGFPLGQQNNGTLPFKIYNGHNEYVFTANDTLPNGNAMNWGTNRLFMDDNYRQDYANQAQFYNFQLIKIGTGTELIVKDSSGYGHIGTIVGDLILNTETKRYSTSIKWNSSDPTASNETGICYIQTPITLTTPLQMSITWWAKPESGYGGGTGHAALCTSNKSSRPDDHNTTAFHHRDNGFDICPSDGTGSKRLSFTYTKNEWHHYALTYDGTTARAYKDGTQTTDVTIGTNKTLATFSQLYIGYSQAGGVRRKTLGTYSDFRMYCTALDADAIRQLYEVGAKIDNKDNFHTFELAELNNGRELLSVPLTTSYGNHTNIYTSYDANGEIMLTGSSSIGSYYIPINPNGKTYYYDIEISTDSGNVFYIGFQRYDASKTARSNDATVYLPGLSGSNEARTHKHYHGTVDLSTDGVNPCAFTSLRILNDWSGANNRHATIHKISLREVSTLQNTKINKQGQSITTELIEMNDKFRVHKNGIIEANEIIEL